MSGVEWHIVFDSLDTGLKMIPDGKAILVEAGEERVCLSRSGEKFYAFHHACPHQQAPLIRGWMESDGIWICPFHRYRYSLHNGKDLSSGGNTLPCFAVKVSSEGLAVGIPKRKVPWWKFW